MTKIVKKKKKVVKRGVKATKITKEVIPQDTEDGSEINISEPLLDLDSTELTLEDNIDEPSELPEKVIQPTEITETDLTPSVQTALEIEVTEDEMPDNETTKTCEITETERIKKRCERFNFISDSERKRMRLERFGGTNNVAVNIDLLKKRAERFGVVTSPVLIKEIDEEKLKKRREKYGLTEKLSIDQKKIDRMKRFSNTGTKDSTVET
ncbi:Nuclear protein Hcc-1 [Intoshia linei]|uniref:Nuclear protein Hcc-1 n=1 Tax=Intoshia linei TaxID=1819745 RepID=A0A177AZ31_9BILA|nr:Nuclear protein Hcc-1 [Intoshia linei]